MSTRVRWYILVPITTISVVISVWAVLPARGPIISWKSPRMLALQREWPALYDSLEGKRSKDNGEQQAMLDGVLERGLSKEDLPATWR